MISIVESISNLLRDKCDFIVSTKLHLRIMLSEYVQWQAFFWVGFGCKRSLLKLLLLTHNAACSYTLMGHFTQYPSGSAVCEILRAARLASTTRVAGFSVA